MFEGEVLDWVARHYISELFSMPTILVSCCKSIVAVVDGCPGLFLDLFRLSSCLTK